MSTTPATKNGPRVRYITAGIANRNDPVSDFKLAAVGMISKTLIAIKVIIPNDMDLKKYRGDSFATTKDKRTLNALGAVPVVRIDGKWVEMPQLWDYGWPHTWHEKLSQMGYTATSSARGYLTQKQFRRYMDKKYQQSGK